MKNKNLGIDLGHKQATVKNLSHLGQGTVEYILLLSFVSFITGYLVKQIRSQLVNSVLIIGGVLEKDLKTGRRALGTWSN